MTTSVYAHGPAKIEIGKFGGPPDKAQAYVLEKAKSLNLTWKIKGNTIVFDYVHDGMDSMYSFHSKTQQLLGQLANIEDLHGDAPCEYSFKENSVPEGTYVKTGVYND